MRINLISPRCCGSCSSSEGRTDETQRCCCCQQVAASCCQCGKRLADALKGLLCDSSSNASQQEPVAQGVAQQWC
jgi:hypothetical protein